MLMPVPQLLLLLMSAAAAATHGDIFCEPNQPKTLKIHLVPHTHDDVGWLKTVDQYFYGLNNTIQQAHVSLILDNVHNQLLDNSKHNRTFTYVETAYFAKWYALQSPSQQDSLKSLVHKKQFSFANGGWCMHDEATTHYIGMIDQTTLGHDFLKQELGVIPSIGWQIDPFGHSATQGGLLTTGMGFNALYFGRIHYVELENRQKDGECEGLWESSSMMDTTFWGLSGSFTGNYGAPKGFCFDALCDDEPLVGLEEERLQQRIEDFLQLVKEQTSRTKGSNVMLTMGMDFQFSQARKNYQNLDLLIDATKHFLNNGAIDVNEIFSGLFDDVEISYSTPERYTQCKYRDFLHSRRRDVTVNSEFAHQASSAKVTDSINWKVKESGDFFPYADCDHCYWTGYFTSRQGLKRLERVGSSYLHAVRQIHSQIALSSITIEHGSAVEINVNGKLDSDAEEKLSGLIPRVKAWNNSPLFELDDAMGVAQHHDAVSGTSKQHVAYDYAKQISKGINSASVFATQALRELLLDTSAHGLENLSYCHLLNETTCDVSQIASEDENQTIHVVVYNALAVNRSEIIPLPINDQNANYSVERLVNHNEWQQVSTSLVPNSNYPNTSGAASAILYFDAAVPPISSTIFRINRAESENVSDLADPGMQSSANANTLDSPDKGTSHLRAKQVDIDIENENEIVISNGLLTVHCDRSTGVIKAIVDNDSGIAVDIEQNYGYYEAFSVEGNQEVTDPPPFDTTFNVKGAGMCLPGYVDSEGDELPWLLGSAETWQNGGAYVFRTSDIDLHVISEVASTVTVYKTEIVSEVHSEFGSGNQPLIKQITRLVKGKDYVEVEYVVSPIPVDDGIGKEIISRFSTNIDNGGAFFTDSNGREFMERTRGDNKLYGTPEHDPVAIEQVAGNFYPANSAVYIEDKDRSFNVLVDRSQGASSLSDGSVELMIQRRLLYDDARGVNEALNETDSGITPNPPYGSATRIGDGIVVKGIHRLMVGQGQTAAAMARSRMDEIFSPMHLFVSSAPKGTEIQFKDTSFSALESSLPSNIMLITYSVRSNGSYLVRLAHQFGVDESIKDSVPTEVDLKILFPSKTISSFTEKTLSGNQNRIDWEQSRLHWGNNFTPFQYEDSRVLNENTIVILRPLEIRTFEVEVVA